MGIWYGLWSVYGTVYDEYMVWYMMGIQYGI